MFKTTEKITKSRPLIRKFILISIDIITLILSINFFLWITKGTFLRESIDSFFDLSTFLLISVLVFLFSGHYKGLVRYQGSKSLYLIALRNIISITISALLISKNNWDSFSFEGYIVLWIFSTTFVGSIKFFIRDFLLFYRRKRNFKSSIKVIIYGAGQAGAQLAASLILTDNYEIISFIDDNPDLWKRSLKDIPINPPSKINKFKSGIDQILIALPSINQNRFKQLIDNLSKFNIPILKVPTLSEISSGKAKINKLKPISVEDLLGRDPVKPLNNLLGPGIENSVVAVTGAGGSIGSELCNQILLLKPNKLILFEISEPSLYEINQKLNSHEDIKTELIPILGDVANFNLIKEIFNIHKVSIIFHAAAYKHVNISEINLISVLKNNIFSTNSIAKACIETSVKKAILISSDKAVRPTNIMGASKRIAEQIFQAYAFKEGINTNKNSTLFSMVRFGNVIGSSGSVVPLFEKQIRNGGPITLTHPEVVRYFMTIREAVELLIQASVLTKGGEVFLLEMGNPVKIKDLAYKMISLSNHNKKDQIELKIIGLKPGEKLYEELIIDSTCQSTEHKLIYKAKEQCIDPSKFFPILELLKNEILANRELESIKFVKKLVPEWNISDYFKEKYENLIS
ncbi:polysaccharide biosynthesis protein [Prochlorococcus marinus]|uniref:polysaccharide biosynthesis protein n=1 Tax=Prochlorococcus marinus TaxID=1219 RepID=UPI001ADCBFBE|nr:nucleoside-diphosphate sugar epimerase/dehydratase [Prochlorococcus marinus]MBO8219555.1 polysaccharide biosynthesis protein [Prochlorococcus marinus CUG1416]